MYGYKKKLRERSTNRDLIAKIVYSLYINPFEHLGAPNASKVLHQVFDAIAHLAPKFWKLVEVTGFSNGGESYYSYYSYHSYYSYYSYYNYYSDYSDYSDYSYYTYCCYYSYYYKYST